MLFRCPMSPGLWSSHEQSPFSNAPPLRFRDKNDAYIFDFFFFLVFVLWSWFDHYFLIYSFLTILLCTWPQHPTHTHTSTLYSLQQKFCLTYYISLSSSKTLHNRCLIMFGCLFLLLKIRQLVLVIRVYFHVNHAYLQ